ncbi:hypothetical protein [Loktanella salsilacus]|jgi:flagellar biosynthesis/type III secretory pathway chaperone|uniref:hypothetical protein n=1 Tax=Loktanella salsilacus TaxID=195913 RepID=UPI0020B7381E|nr:hypothetical protein [Loktanella salsilacus]MBU0780666.1 hypothetical protein [Alphaproteobacteria bacterium]MBU1837021.1 hypothetical protein [Alphaproteobacteria bacterium]UTH44518.1 hypothetical protein KBK07_15880 [Loktanella salsilacus]
MRNTPAEDLLDLLADERKLIRSGDLMDLSDLADRKAFLAQSVAAAIPPGPIATQLDQALQRNARLLLAVCGGIRSAQARLTALNEVRNGLSLYTAAGERQTVARRSDILEHKA